MSSYLKWHNVSIGSILVDLIHCALKSHGLLRQVFQVLGAFFGLFVMFSELSQKQRYVASQRQSKGIPKLGLNPSTKMVAGGCMRLPAETH